MNMKDIFYKTLIEGGSYIILLQGLLVTIQISIFSALWGTVLGAGVCALKNSRYKVFRAAATIYMAVFRGAPALLLLMLMYYVVFACTKISAVGTAVAAFSLHTSAFTASSFHAALQAVDPMQAEAARTLGFSKWQTFYLITLPQAAQIAKATYQSAIVTLIQWTSVVGYVTITDLTRVINNISSRTMQPLFMIVVGILLYIGMAYVCYGLFALADRVTAVRARRRCRE